MPWEESLSQTAEDITLGLVAEHWLKTPQGTVPHVTQGIPSFNLGMFKFFSSDKYKRISKADLLTIGLLNY